MESREYRVLFEQEADYWWFRALRGVLLDTCRCLDLGRSARLLDAGCGTGKNLEALGDAVSPRAVGFDVAFEVPEFWRRRNLVKTCRASVNAIPFCDESFDAVLSVDVLESEGVDELAAYQELYRVLRPGGYLIVVVSAYRWLMSPDHHQAVHAVRRYTRRRLQKLHPQGGVHVRSTHLFGSLFVPIAAFRLWKRLKGPKKVGSPRSELRRLPRLVNELLFRMVDWERHLLRRVDLPFGSSILSVVQKPD